MEIDFRPTFDSILHGRFERAAVDAQFATIGRHVTQKVIRALASDYFGSRIACKLFGPFVPGNYAAL
jgi:hypothetical protein